MKNEIVEYLIVNKDLNMSIGKTCAQVAHAQTLIDGLIKHYADHHNNPKLPPAPTDWIKQLEWYEQWLMDSSQKKIILRAKESKMLKAIEIGAVEVKDNCLTEIPANSLTVVGFMPQPKENLQEFTKRLQLL